jgi:hypothetical protein
MLGMSSAATAAQVAATQSVATSAPAKVFANNKIDIRALLSRINLTPVINALKEIKLKAPQRIKMVKRNEPEEFTSTVDIEEWLAKITSKAHAKRASSAKSPTKSPVKKPTKPTKKR